MSMAAPSGGQFPSRDALIEHVGAHGAANGYGVSIGRSKQHKVYLACDRGGNYRNRLNLTNETRQKNTTKEPTTFGLCMFVMQSTIMAPHRIGRPIRLFENSTKMRGTG
ncbi:hypothetical protein PsorP6_017906 [Peronosclerospora sorghi]|uniref:Uncharacterized protein n=1 Tax=Peronosclerospora sorghi TaxID=230839 RepID=A0ACC0WCW0_9STRA|nr:hypothetical protein PsorP6_017906 [Peronosclerospora sorghi]